MHDKVNRNVHIAADLHWNMHIFQMWSLLFCVLQWLCSFITDKIYCFKANHTTNITLHNAQWHNELFLRNVIKLNLSFM